MGRNNVVGIWFRIILIFFISLFFCVLSAKTTRAGTVQYEVGDFDHGAGIDAEGFYHHWILDGVYGRPSDSNNELYGIEVGPYTGGEGYPPNWVTISTFDAQPPGVTGNSSGFLTTSERRMVIDHAKTHFSGGGDTWYFHGGIPPDAHWAPWQCGDMSAPVYYYCDCVGLVDDAYEHAGHDLDTTDTPIISWTLYTCAQSGSIYYEPPTCSITSPSADAIRRGTVTIRDNGVSDDKTGSYPACSGIDRVHFWVWKNSQWNELPDSPDETDVNISGDYSCSWVTGSSNGYPDGDYYLVSRAYDRAGNYKDSSSIKVTVDNTKPQVSSTNPPNDATALPTLTTVSATMNEGMKQSLNTGGCSISVVPGGGENATISFSPGWISSNTVQFAIHDPAAAPGNNLQCGATYTVTIWGFQDLAEDNGGTGNTLNSYNWHFHTSCPSVKEITPKGTLSLANPVFVVKFIDPVAPMDKESTQTAFSINNDATIEPLSWEDDYTIKLKAVNLKPNTTYTITIDGKKARNTKGETLIGGDYRWEVKTGEK